MVLLPHTQRSVPQVSLAPTKLAPTKLAPTKVAIVGAELKTHLLPILLAHPQAEVLAVSDWETAVKLPGLEAVVIATPAATSYRFIQAALQNHLHVLTDSLPIDPVDAIELCCLAVANQRQLLINHTSLFHPAVSQGQQVVQQLGLRYGCASRPLNSVRSDVEALWELAIHDIAIFNHWLNEVPSQVQAQGKTWLQANANLEASRDRFFPGLSDLIWIKLVYPSGFQASIHLCRSTPDQQRLSIVGSQATLVFSELSQTPLTLLQDPLACHQPSYTSIDLDAIDLDAIDLDAIDLDAIDLDAIDPLQAVCTHFLDCIQTNAPSQIASGWLGAELVQILEALTRSLHQNGQPVTLALRQP